MRKRRGSPNAYVVDGLAADFKVTCEFGLLHFGMQVGGIAEPGYVFGGNAHPMEGYFHEVVECYVAVAFVGERLEKRQEPVDVESESEEGFRHKGGFGMGWYRRGYFLRLRPVSQADQHNK